MARSKRSPPKRLRPSLGLDIVALETFAQTGTSFTAQLVRVRSFRARHRLLRRYRRAGLLIYNEYRQLGLNYPLCFMIAVMTGAFFQAIGGASEAEGVMTPGLLGMLGDRAKGKSGKLYTQLVETGRPASMPNSLGWDMAILTEAAAKKSDGTREGIRAALEQVKDLRHQRAHLLYGAESPVRTRAVSRC